MKNICFGSKQSTIQTLNYALLKIATHILMISTNALNVKTHFALNVCFVSIKGHAISTSKNSSKIGRDVLSAKFLYSVHKVAIIWPADVHTNSVTFVWMLGSHNIMNVAKWPKTFAYSFSITDTCINLLTKRSSKIALKMQTNPTRIRNDHHPSDSSHHHSLNLLDLQCNWCSYCRSH